MVVRNQMSQTPGLQVNQGTGSLASFLYYITMKKYLQYVNFMNLFLEYECFNVSPIVNTSITF